MNITPGASYTGQPVGVSNSTALLLSLVNQSFVLPSHATNIARQGWPPEYPWGPHMCCFGVWKEPWLHIHTQLKYSHRPTLEVGFLAGEAPLSVPQSQEDMGEVRAWQIQGIIRPLSSLQLSLTRPVGEDEGDRREFMTYPSSRRGALGHSETKTYGKQRREIQERHETRKNWRNFLWRWKRKWKGKRERNAARGGYILQMLPFDCWQKSRQSSRCMLISFWRL